MTNLTRGLDNGPSDEIEQCEHRYGSGLNDLGCTSKCFKKIEGEQTVPATPVLNRFLRGSGRCKDQPTLSADLAQQIFRRTGIFLSDWRNKYLRSSAACETAVEEEHDVCSGDSRKEVRELIQVDGAGVECKRVGIMSNQ